MPDAGSTRDAAVATAGRLWVEEVEFLRGLVRRPSVRGDTNRVQEFVAAELRRQGLAVAELGIDPEVLEGRRGYSPVDWSYQGLYNVVGRARGAGGGRSLVLNGHADVVSAEPAGHWRHDPWGAEISGGRMYGRGAADMKAGVAAMVFALKAVRAAGIALAGDVTVQSVIDEECSGNGTLACLVAGSTADAAIIPEPTGLGFVTAHPGVLWCRIEVRGFGAHARQAAAAVNAADKAYLLVAAIRRLEEEWNRPDRVHPALRELAHPINFNLVTIHAGDWPSTVPQECVVGMRLAFHPGESLDAVKAAVLERVAEAAAADPWLRETPPRVDFTGFHAEGAVYDLESDIARTVADCHRRLTGRNLKASASPATFDARLFELSFGIPSVLYGPAGDQLHGTDEWVDLDSVRDLTGVLAAALVDWCGVA